MIQHDVIVVGSGIAGMRCALEIKRSAPQANVAIVTKQYPVRAASVVERTGIAAALGNSSADSVEAHISDTLAYGKSNNAAAVKTLCELAPAAVYELEHMGLPFSRLKSGRIAQQPAYGHSQPRLANAGDQTGHAIVTTLYGEIVRFGIQVYPEQFMLGLVVDGKNVRGVSVLDIRSSEINIINAKVTVLATGSYGQLYANSADSYASTGDGHAAALRAGINLTGMDLVTFHPLGVANTGLIINERVLADGAHLLNAAEKRFTNELASLDVVAAAINAEIAAGNGVDGHVWLDVRHLPTSQIRERYPHVLDYAEDFAGVNPKHDLIPVKPTQQATLGGLSTDLNGSVAGFEGLYAVGACANNGVHGEQALPGNELAAAVVFAKLAGAAIVAKLGSAVHGNVPSYATSNASDEVEGLLGQKGAHKLGLVRKNLRHAFSSQSASNEQQVGFVHSLRDQFGQIGLHDKNRRFNTELLEALELDRLLDVADAVAKASVAAL
ncbi:FAD-binding protein [Herpetosiphon llansteffanensis]